MTKILPSYNLKDPPLHSLIDLTQKHTTNLQTTKHTSTDTDSYHPHVQARVMPLEKLIDELLS